METSGPDCNTEIDSSCSASRSVLVATLCSPSVLESYSAATALIRDCTDAALCASIVSSLSLCCAPSLAPHVLSNALAVASVAAALARKPKPSESDFSEDSIPICDDCGWEMAREKCHRCSNLPTALSELFPVLFERVPPVLTDELATLIVCKWVRNRVWTKGDPVVSAVACRLPSLLSGCSPVILSSSTAVWKLMELICRAYVNGATVIEGVLPCIGRELALARPVTSFHAHLQSPVPHHDFDCFVHKIGIGGVPLLCILRQLLTLFLLRHISPDLDCVSSLVSQLDETPNALDRLCTTFSCHDSLMLKFAVLAVPFYSPACLLYSVCAAFCFDDALLAELALSGSVPCLELLCATLRKLAEAWESRFEGGLSVSNFEEVVSCIIRLRIRLDTPASEFNLRPLITRIALVESLYDGLDVPKKRAKV